MYFKRKELEKFRSFKGPLIDVRSPSEYYKGHLPNSINIPLFDYDERSIIGSIYKKEGRKINFIEGLKFFEKKMELLLDNLFKSIESHTTIPNKNNELFELDKQSYGPIIIQSKSYEKIKSRKVLNVLNQENKKLILSINCDKNELDVRIPGRKWRGEEPPKEEFEKNLINDFC